MSSVFVRKIGARSRSYTYTPACYGSILVKLSRLKIGERVRFDSNILGRLNPTCSIITTDHNVVERAGFTPAFLAPNASVLICITTSRYIGKSPRFRPRSYDFGDRRATNTLVTLAFARGARALYHR